MLDSFSEGIIYPGRTALVVLVMMALSALLSAN